MEVVRELERDGLTFEELRRKYGIKGCGTVQLWVGKYGNGTRGKVIRLEKPEEINELKRLKQRVRNLETAMADGNVDLAIERAYTKTTLGPFGPCPCGKSLSPCGSISRFVQQGDARRDALRDYGAGAVSIDGRNLKYRGGSMTGSNHCVRPGGLVAMEVQFVRFVE